MGKLRWEGARPDAGRDEAVGNNSLGKLRREGARPDARRDEAVEIGLGKLRWKGARPDARRDEAVEIAWGNSLGNFAGRERDRMLDGMKPWKSLGETSLGGSETGCWTG